MIPNFFLQGAERVAPGQEDKSVSLRVRRNHKGHALHRRQEDGQDDGRGGGGQYQVGSLKP